MASCWSKNKRVCAELLSKKLCELQPDGNNVLVIALIINKTDPNMFLAKNDTQYKGVINFTIRDSKKHIVNCKFWGLWEKTEEYYNKFQLGDVVDIVCPKISFTELKADNKEPRYQPLTTLPITLILNEGYSFMEKHNIHDADVYEQLNQLWRISHIPLFNVLKLKDVKVGVSAKKTDIYFSDFLVVVTLIKSTRELKTFRDNKVKHCLELAVTDESLPEGMVLTIWNKDWIKRAKEFWHPLQTVLHLIDVQISHSSYYNDCILSHTSRSLIYENPYGEETQTLLKNVDIVSPSIFYGLFQNTGSNMPKPDEIVTVMTVQQIYALYENSPSNSLEVFTAVLYAMITHFDLDGLYTPLSKKCKFCKQLISKSKTVCDSEKCDLSFTLNHVEEKFEYFFDIQMHLSDHTGTLLESRLSGAIAERVLGLNCLEFQKLSSNQLEELKWRFLMEYFQIKLVIKRTKNIRKNLIINVVDMKFIELEELCKNIPVF